MTREDIEECRRWVKEGINTQEWVAAESERCTRLIDDVCNAALLSLSERGHIDLSSYVNTAHISGADAPHVVVQKLQLAINAAAPEICSSAQQECGVEDSRGSGNPTAAAPAFSSDKWETPRTDAAVAKWLRELADDEEASAAIEFARQLERELADVTDRLAGYERHVAVLEGMQETREEEDLSATRESVLEEAAKVCEQMRPVNASTNVLTVQRDTLDNAARLIRALKP